MKRKKNQRSKKFFLKEIAIGILLRKDISFRKGWDFIESLAKAIKMKIIKPLYGNDLKPGWDIFCFIKQSHIALSYYPECNYLRLFICSCKDFDVCKVGDFVEKFFKPKKIKLDLNKNKTLKKEIDILQNYL